MMELSMLTTIDNPYDPFDQWDPWYQWDCQHGYNTAGLLARLTYQSDDISEADQALAVERAIDDVVAITGGLHIKVTRSVPDT